MFNCDKNIITDYSDANKLDQERPETLPNSMSIMVYVY